MKAMEIFYCINNFPIKFIIIVIDAVHLHWFLPLKPVDVKMHSSCYRLAIIKLEVKNNKHCSCTLLNV